MAEPQAPEPDDKDWTWTLQRPCPECGFDTAAIEPVAIPVLARPDAATRPAPTTWSPLEYACHVRDVHQIFRERLELMLAENDPAFANWDQDASALAERYWEQDPAVVATEVTETGEALADAYSRVGDDQWDRTGVRSNGSTFTVESLGRYVLHDLHHHVWDVRG